MTTFTPEETPDLSIDMPQSTLHMGTRVISSDARTTITRRDFNISGDKMKFDTNSRQGTLVGNVKMVITDTSELMDKPGE
jgi:lipopolysaccharide export system protein LptC